MVRTRMVTAGALAGFVAVSCQGGGGQSPAPGPGVTSVVMREYRFDHPPRISAGRMVFRVVNRGRVPHKLTLVPLPEDLPPIDVQLRGSERRPLVPLATIPARMAGKSAIFAVDLTPGRYALICFVRDADGTVHGLKGMNSELRVVPPPP